MLSIPVIGYRCSWADFVRQPWQQSCVIHQCNSLLQSPPLQPWRHSVQYFPLIKKSSLAFQVPLWQVLQFSNKLQPQKEIERRKADKKNKYRNVVVASQGYVVFTVLYEMWSCNRWCTWVKNTRVTLIEGVPAAGNSVAHLQPFGGTPTLDQLVLATWPTHGVPAGAWTAVRC